MSDSAKHLRGDSTPSSANVWSWRKRIPEIALLTSLLFRFFSHPPFQFSPLVWISLVGFFIFLHETSSWPKLLVGTWIWNFLFIASSLAWLRHVTYPGWIAVCAILGFYSFLFVIPWIWIDPGRNVFHALAGGFCWILLEYGRSFILGGFPYVYLSHAVAHWTPLIQIAHVTGAWGVSLLIFWTNLAFFVFLKPFLQRQGLVGKRWEFNHAQKLIIGTAGLLLPLVCTGYGYLARQKIQTNPGPTVGIVQGNIPQSVKNKPQSSEYIYDRYRTLSRKISRESDLVIWPETMYPYPIRIFEGNSIEPYRPEQLRALVKDSRSDLLIGARTLHLKQGKITRDYNSAWLINKKGEPVDVYHKYHLVPFGEFVPGKQLLQPFLSIAKVKQIPDLTHGSPPEKSKLISWNEYKMAPLICYEVAFPEEFRTHARKRPDFIPNLSNEGWYKEEAELDQMLAICRYRAVETRLAIVRSTNTGLSGCVHPDGTVNLFQDEEGTSRGVIGTMTIRVPLRSGGPTLYTKFGNWLPHSSILIVLLLLLYRFFWVSGESRNNGNEQ